MGPGSPQREHRPDVDGLRAIAVLAVVAFHSGLLPSGFLGVDVFFVISGYLITGILYRELEAGRVRVAAFYLRRVRRIVPLVLTTCLVCLVAGYVTMLPDDFENLGQSVVATLFFGNNVLQDFTTRDYWGVANDYKPLHHTWSLGVEEQYYLLYPLLFAWLGKARRAWVAPLLGVLAALSLALCALRFPASTRFYQLPFRFYELAAGGLCAVAVPRGRLPRRLGPALLILLGVTLVAGAGLFPGRWIVVPTVLLTCGVLVADNESHPLARAVLCHPAVVWTGKISFSIYMWHQVLLAFARYALFPELSAVHLLGIVAATLALSLATYAGIERPFRDGLAVPVGRLLLGTGTLFVALASSGLYVHYKGGVLRDFPTLGLARNSITKDLSAPTRGVQAAYSSRVHAMDRDFSAPERTAVLVLCNSFGRDWANVLLESSVRDRIEVSYVSDPAKHPGFAARASAADVIFHASPRPGDAALLAAHRAKLWAVGVKRFGKSNGIFHNHRGEGYFEQRAAIDAGLLAANERLRTEWAPRFVDLVGAVADAHTTVPVFTPWGRFISPDGRHLTEDGARYFAQLLDARIRSIVDVPAAEAP